MVFLDPPRHLIKAQKPRRGGVIKPRYRSEGRRQESGGVLGGSATLYLRTLNLFSHLVRGMQYRVR